MKKLLLSLSIFTFSFAILASSQAWADACGDAIKAAAEKAAKDKDCQKDAKNYAAALSKQINICKDFRALKRACRKAKQDDISECNKIKDNKKKRACKKNARHEKRACKNDAKNTQAFAVCKDARKLTNKALGNTLKCAGKYFLPATLVCVAQLFAND